MYMLYIYIFICVLSSKHIHATRFWAAANAVFHADSIKYECVRVKHKPCSPSKSNFSSLLWFFLSCLSCFSISALIRLISLCSSLKQHVILKQQIASDRHNQSQRWRQKQLLLSFSLLEPLMELRVLCYYRIYSSKMVIQFAVVGRRRASIAFPSNHWKTSRSATHPNKAIASIFGCKFSSPQTKNAAFLRPLETPGDIWSLFLPPFCVRKKGWNFPALTLLNRLYKDDLKEDLFQKINLLEQTKKIIHKQNGNDCIWWKVVYKTNIWHLNCEL